MGRVASFPVTIHSNMQNFAAPVFHSSPPMVTHPPPQSKRLPFHVPHLFTPFHNKRTAHNNSKNTPYSLTFSPATQYPNAPI